MTLLNDDVNRLARCKERNRSDAFGLRVGNYSLPAGSGTLRIARDGYGIIAPQPVISRHRETRIFDTTLAVAYNVPCGVHPRTMRKLRVHKAPHYEAASNRVKATMFRANPKRELAVARCARRALFRSGTRELCASVSSRRIATTFANASICRHRIWKLSTIRYTRLRTRGERETRTQPPRLISEKILRTCWIIE